MDFVGIFFLVVLGYKNSVRAKLKGQNGLLWAFITILSFIFWEGVGLFIVVSLFCRDVVDMHLLTRNSGNFDVVSRQFNQQVLKALADNPIRELTVLVFGIGGYLLVRYILDIKPDKKQPEPQPVDGEK